ncbi:DUF309 domain-containing protein [Paenibacillus campi]|uniref:DUF309 domain-containing protein n=1 Tax=Paenibacillus campi TaxID=3106031 RepID=UPI002B00372C|nr:MULTISPECIES: DUF309 domain-containing protein [unclassified Paenibacillus]
MSHEFHPLYIAYLVYFNRDRDYFECHEVLEELWLEKDREPVYKGLLQVAVGLFHFRNGTVNSMYNKRLGAIKMLNSSLHKLNACSHHALGIDMERLLADVRQYIARLERYEHEPFDFYPLDICITDPLLRKEVKAGCKKLAPHLPLRTGYERGPKAKEWRPD